MLPERADRLALVFCFLFVAVASVWLGETGVQNDEALFAAGIYGPYLDAPLVFGKPFPTMVMTYVGALKSHLYRPIFRYWKPSPASVRFPGILLGALTVWLFYLLLKRTLGIRTALIGTALLATDASFVLTTRWDWGPVVIQHLCLVGGVLALVRFEQGRKLRWLALGCFVFGLGIWDKAIFLWSLVGLTCAVLAVFPMRFLALFKRRTVLVASLAFLSGAAPLIAYNVHNNFATFRQNTSWTTEIFAYKANLLRGTLSGGALFGSIAREDWDLPVREPGGPDKRALVAVNQFFGGPRRNLQVPLLLFSLALLPFVWRTPARNAFLFSLIYVAITWAQMAFLRDAGTGAHHTVLVWPMPHLAIAAILGAASLKAGRNGAMLASFLVGVACCANLLVISTYYKNMLRNGGSVAWTDAIYPAFDALPNMQPEYVCIIDWGLYEPLRLLHRGRLRLCNAADPDHDLPFFRRQAGNPNFVFLTHTKGNEFRPGLTERFLARAKAEGFAPSFRKVFYDYNGRPIIEVFKLFRP